MDEARLTQTLTVKRKDPQRDTQGTHRYRHAETHTLSQATCNTETHTDIQSHINIHNNTFSHKYT